MHDQSLFENERDNSECYVEFAIANGDSEDQEIVKTTPNLKKSLIDR